MPSKKYPNVSCPTTKIEAGVGTEKVAVPKTGPFPPADVKALFVASYVKEVAFVSVRFCGLLSRTRVILEPDPNTTAFTSAASNHNKHPGILLGLKKTRGFELGKKAWTWTGIDN